MDEPPVLICNLNAIGADERSRYHELVVKLRHSIVGLDELPDGYELRVAEAMSLAELGEWMQMERRCCPFLVFRIDVGAETEEYKLTLRGPSGTKAILATAFSS